MLTLKYTLAALGIWRRQWHPTPVLLPGKSHERRSLVGYSPWGCKESDTTERLHFQLFTFMHWRRKWQPTPVGCLENLRDGGAWWAAVYGVAQSRTQLTRLSSSSSSSFRNYSCCYSEGFYFYKNRNQKCRKELQHSDYYMELCSGERNCACPMFKHLFQS